MSVPRKTHLRKPCDDLPDSAATTAQPSDVITEQPVVGMPHYGVQAAAELLTARGFRTAAGYLNKLASQGGGPRYRKYGRYRLYPESELLAWAERRSGPLRASTSEAA